MGLKLEIALSVVLPSEGGNWVSEGDGAGSDEVLDGFQTLRVFERECLVMLKVEGLNFAVDVVSEGDVISEDSNNLVR